MDFSSLRYADVVVVAPTGRIDHASAEPFQLALEPILVAVAGMDGAVVLDLSAVDYISSVGLRVVMMAAKHLRAGKARIAAVSLQPVVNEIFEIARFNHVVEIFPSLPDALAALSTPALAAYEAGTGSPAA
ncbi:MAG: STAS domain-containing protein [Caldimonas sp.]